MSGANLTFALVWFLPEAITAKDSIAERQKKKGGVSHAILLQVVPGPSAGSWLPPTTTALMASYGVVESVSTAPAKRTSPEPHIWREEGGIYRFYYPQSPNTWSGYIDIFGTSCNSVRTVVMTEQQLKRWGEDWIAKKDTSHSTAYPWNCRGAVDYALYKTTTSFDRIEFLSKSEENDLKKALNMTAQGREKEEKKGEVAEEE